MNSGLLSLVYLCLEGSNLSYPILYLVSLFFLKFLFSDRHCAKYLTSLLYLILTILQMRKLRVREVRKKCIHSKLYSQYLNQSLSDPKAHTLNHAAKTNYETFTLPVNGL